MAKGKIPLIPIDESLSADVEDDVVAINRSSAVVKGGRRFSFSALSVVGNRNGLVGIGYGKANEVPNAIEKSVKDARKQIMRVCRNGSTIPHMPEGEYGATKVRLLPAAPGTGIIAGKAVRKVLERAGMIGMEREVDLPEIKAIIAAYVLYSATPSSSNRRMLLGDEMVN